MNESLKVQPHHLERAAYLYVRQSSMRQVIENIESTDCARASTCAFAVPRCPDS